MLHRSQGCARFAEICVACQKIEPVGATESKIWGNFNVKTRKNSEHILAKNLAHHTILQNFSKTSTPLVSNTSDVTFWTNAETSTKFKKWWHLNCGQQGHLYYNDSDIKRVPGTDGTTPYLSHRWRLSIVFEFYIPNLPFKEPCNSFLNQQRRKKHTLSKYREVCQYQ